MGYEEQKLRKAADAAMNENGWDVSWEFLYQEKAGYNSNVYHYRVSVDGQYAEDEAEDFFRSFDFYSVSLEYTDHSYAELEIQCESGY